MQIDEIPDGRWMRNLIGVWSVFLAFVTVFYYDMKNRSLLLFVELNWANYWSEASIEARMGGDYREIYFQSVWNVRQWIRRWIS